MTFGAADLFDFIPHPSIGDMLAVPGDQVIKSVDDGYRNMDGIFRRLFGQGSFADQVLG